MYTWPSARASPTEKVCPSTRGDASVRGMTRITPTRARFPFRPNALARDGKLTKSAGFCIHEPPGARQVDLSQDASSAPRHGPAEAEVTAPQPLGRQCRSVIRAGEMA